VQNFSQYFDCRWQLLRDISYEELKHVRPATDMDEEVCLSLFLFGFVFVCRRQKCPGCLEETKGCY
jgi:hypothetical protein